MYTYIDYITCTFIILYGQECLNHGGSNSIQWGNRKFLGCTQWSPIELKIRWKYVLYEYTVTPSLLNSILSGNNVILRWFLWKHIHIGCFIIKYTYIIIGTILWLNDKEIILFVYNKRGLKCNISLLNETLKPWIIIQLFCLRPVIKSDNNKLIAGFLDYGWEVVYIKLRYVHPSVRPDSKLNKKYELGIA